MKKIGLKQWVVDLLDNEEMLEEAKKKLDGKDTFFNSKNKLVELEENEQSN